MSSRLPTADQVMADANKARQKLSDLEHKLQVGIDEIVFAAFKAGRPLSEADKAKRRELRTAQMEVREQFDVLGFVTMDRLDDTAEVSQLLHQMQTINAGLQDDFARLKKIERYSAIVAQVADAIAKAAERLAVVAAKGIS